jgi:hypothetical protein
VVALELQTESRAAEKLQQELIATVASRKETRSCLDRLAVSQSRAADLSKVIEWLLPQTSGGRRGIQDIPAGNINILRGHSFGQCKQKGVYGHVSCVERFPR